MIKNILLYKNNLKNNTLNSKKILNFDDDQSTNSNIKINKQNSTNTNNYNEEIK